METISCPFCCDPITIESDAVVCGCGYLLLESDFILGELKFEMMYKEIPFSDN